MIHKEHIERQLQHLLQRKLKFTVNGKVLRRGRLIIYRIKDFYITFTLINSRGEKKHYELPYPFAIRNSANKTELDYTLECLSAGNKTLFYKLKVLTKKKKNKLYDSILNIIDDVD